MIGMDFAGPVKYRDKRKEENKAYVVLYSCSLTRSVFGVTAHCGDYRVQETVNCQMFVAAAKWLRKVQKDERFHSFVSDQSIMAIQSQPSTLVGQAIRATDRVNYVSILQDSWSRTA